MLPFTFGQKMRLKLAMDPRLMGGLGGAALGAGIGGLASPNKKPGQRLRHALLGAGIGGVGGAAGVAAVPKIREMLTSRQATPAAPSPSALPPVSTDLEVPDVPHDDATAAKLLEQARENLRRPDAKEMKLVLGLSHDLAPAGKRYAPMFSAPDASDGDEVKRFGGIPGVSGALQGLDSIFVTAPEAARDAMGEGQEILDWLRAEAKKRGGR